MIVSRIEKHTIKSNNSYYNLLDEFCFLSKNLYNHANYLVRNEFISSGKWLSYNDLDSILKNDMEYPDYKSMPTAQSAQQTLRLLEKNWKSFFKSIKKWSKNKEGYTGKPNLPNYKNKNGRYMVILTNQNVKLKDDVLYFPKTFKDFVLKPKCVEKENFINIQQVRFNVLSNHIKMEVVYNIEIPEYIEDNNKYIGIDIGVDNLVAVSNNFGDTPFIINGKGLKSYNKYYNKLIAHYKSISTRMNNQYTTNLIKTITTKRNNVIKNYMHQASRYIVNYAINNNVSKIIIGRNKEWKQDVKMHKKTSQSFVQIPFLMLIKQIQYKAENEGIEVILTEEKYTSGTSYLDNELPIKENYNKKRRIKRGLFKSNDGKYINADINAGYQMIKKVFPNAYADGIEGEVLHPFVVNAFAI